MRTYSYSIRFAGALMVLVGRVRFRAGGPHEEGAFGGSAACGAPAHLEAGDHDLVVVVSGARSNAVLVSVAR